MRALHQVRELTNPAEVYTKLMDFMERLARLGLIHCDFNEFNVMVRLRPRSVLVSCAARSAAMLCLGDLCGAQCNYESSGGWSSCC